LKQVRAQWRRPLTTPVLMTPFSWTWTRCEYPLKIIAYVYAMFSPNLFKLTNTNFVP
jgi:hypothetical protein